MEYFLKIAVQCSVVNFPLLTRALSEYARETPIELVYVNNSAVPELRQNTFAGLKISNLQINHAQLARLDSNAFRGLEDTLQGLNLANNALTEVRI